MINDATQCSKSPRAIAPLCPHLALRSSGAGVWGASPRFRVSETQEGVRGRAATLLRQSYREKAEHGDAGRGERNGEEGDAGVNPRARQAEAFVRTAPRVERRRFLLRTTAFQKDFICIAKGRFAVFLS